MLRRDYVGLETRLTYGNSFKSDLTSRRVDVSAGLNFEGGRTNILLAGSYRDADELLERERGFLQRGRQHILATNPTALFGVRNPPLGATPNIRSAGGENLILDDGTPLNSPITFVPAGYAGLATDGAAPLVANAGQYNLELAPTAQSSGGDRYALLSAPEVKSLMVTLRREFTERIGAFLELQGSQSAAERLTNIANLTAVIPGNTPNNPFQQQIRVTVPTIGMDEPFESESEEHRVVAGVIAQLPKDWQAALDYTWNRSRSSYTRARGLSFTMNAAANSGALDVLRDVNRFPISWEGQVPDSQSPGDMSLNSTALRVAGSLPWSLPGGAPTLATLLEYRKEALDDTVICGFCFGSPSLIPARSQAVKSAYLELRAPLVSKLNRRVGLEFLELQFAARADDYRVTGTTAFVDLANPGPIERVTNRNSSVNPTVGFKYQPMTDLTVRASYGTGYLPPSMTQLVPDPFEPFDLGFLNLTDPLRGNEAVGTVEYRQGGNPDLRPEESESWSVGVILTPQRVAGLRLAADWVRIEKVDNIDGAFGFIQTDFETLVNFFPDRVIRGAPSDGYAVGPVIGLDNTRINIARLQVESVDVALDYQVDTEWFGAFDASVDATRLLKRDIQAAPGAPIVQSVGALLLVDKSLKWRANVAFSWTYRGWSLGWRSRFFDSYFFDPAHTVNPSQGAAFVPSQIYHDLYGRYELTPNLTGTLGFLSDMEIHFNINNIFDKAPPLDVVSGAPAMYSRFADPMLANYSVSIRKSLGR